MRAAARLSLYGLILVAVFAVAGFTANAVVPEDAVQSWVEDTEDNTHHGAEEGGEMNGGGHVGHEADAVSLGLGLAQDGYQLTSVSTPTATGDKSEPAFVVTGPEGSPVSEFELDHQQDMHLIAVRADGQHFVHVHPERDATGAWSVAEPDRYANAA